MRLLPLAKAVLMRETAGLGSDPGRRKVIDEGIAWLNRAQDNSISHDGGVARHFSLLEGWSHSYPETTGYIIPTIIEYGRDTKQTEPILRARRMLDWLADIQFSNGG